MPHPDRFWEFTIEDKKMALTTEHLFKVLHQSGFSSEEILVREGIQNCRDARSEAARESAQPALVVVRKRSLETGTAGKLSEALKLKEQAKRMKDNGTNEQYAELQRILKPGRKEKPSLIEFSDFNTRGLGGVADGKGPEDHFSRLVTSLGASTKSEGGGSFGFGKTVFFKQSKLHLVIYYSSFEPTEATEGVEARFMAVWLFRPHEWEGEDFTGFGFFGAPDPEKEGEVVPFGDEDAHRMAEACGMERRGADKRGTTVLAIGCDPDMKNVKDAVERFWWPSLHEQSIAVKLFDEEEQIPIRPKRNPRVAPFMTAFNDLESDRPGGPERKKSPNGTESRRFQRLRGHQLGWLAMKPLTDVEIADWRKFLEKDGGNEEEGVSTIGGIARIRRSGMVVDYDPSGISQLTPSVGVFQAASDIDGILRISEPQTHNCWDENEGRLNQPDQFPPDRFEPGLGREIVRAVNRRISSGLANFQREIPDPPPPSTYRLKPLESLLSRLLNSGNEIEPPPPPPPRPISLSVSTSRGSGKDRTDKAKIKISLNDDYPEDSLDFELAVDFRLLGDIDAKLMERLPCEVCDAEGEVVGEGVSPTLVATARKGEKLVFKAKGHSETQNKTQFRVEARKLS